jgi:hypothetical protein
MPVKLDINEYGHFVITDGDDNVVIFFALQSLLFKSISHNFLPVHGPFF